MDGLETLLACKEISELRARYYRAVDTFDLAAWLDVFTEDAILEFDLSVSGPSHPEPQRHRIDGKLQIAEFWNSNSNRLQSAHHGHMPEIEIVSEVEARGIWAMEDIVEFTDGRLHGFGHYHETYRKLAGRWLIARLHLTRTMLEFTARNRMSF